MNGVAPEDFPQFFTSSAQANLGRLWLSSREMNYGRGMVMEDNFSTPNNSRRNLGGRAILKAGVPFCHVVYGTAFSTASASCPNFQGFSLDLLVTYARFMLINGSVPRPRVPRAMADHHICNLFTYVGVHKIFHDLAFLSKFSWDTYIGRHLVFQGLQAAGPCTQCHMSISSLKTITLERYCR